MKKKILLARPNALIVEHMKNLIESSGANPLEIKQLEDIELIDEGILAAIVISTSVTSTIPETYQETLDLISKKFSKTPIILATLTQPTSLAALVGKSWESTVRIFTMRDTYLEADPKALYVLQKKDLTDTDTSARVLELFKKFQA